MESRKVLCSHTRSGVCNRSLSSSGSDSESRANFLRVSGLMATALRSIVFRHDHNWKKPTSGEWLCFSFELLVMVVLKKTNEWKMVEGRGKNESYIDWWLNCWNVERRFGLHSARLHQEIGRTIRFRMADQVRPTVPQSVRIALRIVQLEARTGPHGSHWRDQFRVDDVQRRTEYPIAHERRRPSGAHQSGKDRFPPFFFCFFLIGLP